MFSNIPSYRSAVPNGVESHRDEPLNVVSSSIPIRPTADLSPPCQSVALKDFHNTTDCGLIAYSL
jgi:hypothetical protein